MHRCSGNFLEQLSPVFDWPNEKPASPITGFTFVPNLQCPLFAPERSCEVLITVWPTRMADLYINIGKGRRTLQCFYCYLAYTKYEPLLDHLKTHVGDTYVCCGGCTLRKKCSKRSELTRDTNHTCDVNLQRFQVISKESLATACKAVFDLPVPQFNEIWGTKRRARPAKRPLTYTEIPVPVQPIPVPVQPIPVPVQPLTPVRSSPRRSRRVRGKRVPSASLGAAPVVPMTGDPFEPLPDIPVELGDPAHVVDPVVLGDPAYVIDPLRGPLNLGKDLIPASGELAAPLAGLLDISNLNTASAGFGIQGYTCSSDEEDLGMPQFFQAVGLHPTPDFVPGEHVPLGTEVLPSPGVYVHRCLVNYPICVIMPSNSVELITVDQRQYYKMPAKHVDGCPVYLCVPTEQGPPESIFSAFPMFTPLEPPRLPKKCTWLSPNTSHKLDMAIRCVSWPWTWLVTFIKVVLCSMRLYTSARVIVTLVDAAMETL